MLIAFVHSQKAFLPALQGYLDFFKRYNVKTVVCSKRDLRHLTPDVEWHFMGMDTQVRSSVIKIHDYTSASAPPFVYLKNKLKSQLNTKPDFRLFPNQYVLNSFGFKDDVSFGFRDVGITTPNTIGLPKEKKFDFIYVGEMRSRRLEPLFEWFTDGGLIHRSLLLLTRDYETTSRKLKKYSNIQFKGPVPQPEVNDYIRLSRFGINYIPNIEPFNQQASTKFLEYAANRVSIISTRYPWIENFQSKYGGKYFYINDDLANFTWDAVNSFQYEFPDLSDRSWEQQIEKSGVLEFLGGKFPQLIELKR